MKPLGHPSCKKLVTSQRCGNVEHDSCLSAIDWCSTERQIRKWIPVAHAVGISQKNQRGPIGSYNNQNPIALWADFLSFNNLANTRLIAIRGRQGSFWKKMKNKHIYCDLLQYWWITIIFLTQLRTLFLCVLHHIAILEIITDINFLF